MSSRQAWQDLANRSDLIGKEVVFDNRVGDCTDRGMIRRIVVEEEYVTIESDEIEAAYNAGHAWSPHIAFKLKEERYPTLIGTTIFCDLDDNYRQIRISTNAT